MISSDRLQQELTVQITTPICHARLSAYFTYATLYTLAH